MNRAVPGSMTNIGFNIYYWGMEEQQRLLQHGLNAWAQDLRRQGWLQRLWFCPYDARSPHVFGIFTTTAAGENCVKTYLQDSIQKFIAHYPSHVQLSDQEVSERHGGCRGRTMNLADREPGPALNNSFQIFEHEHNGYPFQLNVGAANADELWERIDRVCIWALEQAGGDVSRAAVRWLAAVDRSLKRQEIPAAGYWRFHAGSLLLGLEQSFKERPEMSREWLQNAVSPANQKIFSNIWNEENDLSVDIDGLVRLIISQQKSSLAQRFGLLRSINHFTLLQLGQIVLQEIPIILYAWQRNV
jgi:hypothetical protein